MRLKNSAYLLHVVLGLWVAAAGAQDQLEQDTILIKGNQELPRTLYIAPWKRVGVPLDSDTLEGDIGEETQPLERDLFQRELELQRQGYSVDGKSQAAATHD